LIDLSIVSPVYNSQATINELVTRINDSVTQIGLSYEIILVDDFSRDNSWQSIEKICEQYPNCKGIKLSRNFGQHYAITAGLEHADAEWIVILDCDLQDRPEEISKLYNKALEGYDKVYAKRKIRIDSWFKRTSSKIFYKLFSYLTNTSQDHTIGNFGIYRRKVITEIIKMGDATRFFPIMSQWVGFKSATIEVTHAARITGRSNYNFFSLLRLALDNIVAFSDKLLNLIVRLGFFVSIISFIAGFYILVTYLVGGISVSGFTSLIISIWFLSGLTIMTLGLIGLYIGKMFKQVKQRPVYITEKKLNIE